MSNLIVANFKMHGSHAFIEDWFTNFNQNKTSSHDVVVALPAKTNTGFAGKQTDRHTQTGRRTPTNRQ